MPPGTKKRATKTPKSWPRLSVSFPPESYDAIVRMAEAKRVSTAWIIRDAVEKYTSGDIPLLANIGKQP